MRRQTGWRSFVPHVAASKCHKKNSIRRWRISSRRKTGADAGIGRLGVGLTSKAATRARRFLKAFAQTLAITSAAETADIDRKTHYDRMHTDSQYAQEFEDILMAPERSEVGHGPKRRSGSKHFYIRKGSQGTVNTRLHCTTSPRTMTFPHTDDT